MNQCPPGPQVFQWSHFEFFRKFAEIIANECLSPVSLTPVINIHSRLSPRIFEKIRNGPNGILRGLGDTDL
jgi:hypothetical protein